MDDSDATVSSSRVLLLGVLLLGFGAVGFHEIPGMIAEDAEGTKWVNALYCAVMTLTTVGYGDICPGSIDHFGRTFLVILSMSGLGMFCVFMDLASSWKDRFQGGTFSLLTTTIATAVFVFSYLLEEMSQSEAAYFGIITGTTIGYGDIHPRTDAGKLAAALYACVAINVVATLLVPAKEFFISFCMVESKPPTKIKVDDDNTQISKKDDTKTKSGGSIELSSSGNKKTQ